MMKVLDGVITLGVALLLALILYFIGSYLVVGWITVFQVLGLLWIWSVWPLYSWVEPLGILPAYVSVTALWVALVLETRRHMGLAEATQASTGIGHWSVRLSCTVFGFASFVAWRIHTFVFNLELAATSVPPVSVPLLTTFFAEQLLVITTALGLVIVVPNYAYLPARWARRLAVSVRSWWAAWGDRSLTGKRRQQRTSSPRHGTHRDATAPRDTITGFAHDSFHYDLVYDSPSPSEYRTHKTEDEE